MQGRIRRGGPTEDGLNRKKRRLVAWLNKMGAKAGVDVKIPEGN